MDGKLLTLYHHLPAPMRTVAASLRGLYLRNWRFGRDTHRLIEQAREREQWSPTQWQCWREERLSFLLDRAATRVPFYREQWMKRRREGDRASWHYLENWPALDKESIRANPEAFVADDCDTKKMFSVNTSGTTGKPLRLWRSRKALRELYALSAARTTGWHGLRRGERWARLGGQLVTPVSKRRPPFWVWNAALSQLYMSAYHLAPDLIPHYLDALEDYRISYLFGYTSSLQALAQEAIRLGRRAKMKVVITNGEALHDYQREVISEAFCCAVRETYGMGEMVAAATECLAGTLHQWPEVGIVEVFDGDKAVAADAAGEFICTGLLNEDMPLIRYRVGDCGRVTDDATDCACGRSLPVISVTEGGTYDLLITPDGRQLFGLEDVFFNMPVRQAQIIQESLDLIRVRFVPAPEFTREAGRLITEQLKARVGMINVILEPAERIMLTTNGKFALQVCNLLPDEKDSILQMSRKKSAEDATL